MARLQTRNFRQEPARRGFAPRFLVMIVFLVIIIGVMWLGTAGISGQVQTNQAEFLTDAVRRSAVQCYALEGRFPSDVAYLEDNYGLVIDRTKYVVYYESMGANILPQIRVVIISS